MGGFVGPSGNCKTCFWQRFLLEDAIASKKRGIWFPLSPTASPRDLKCLSHIELQWKYPAATKIGSGGKFRNYHHNQNTSQLDSFCLRSNSILGCRVTREITGRFYGLYLHNMHKLISLEGIKDYWGKLHFPWSYKMNKFSKVYFTSTINMPEAKSAEGRPSWKITVTMVSISVIKFWFWSHIQPESASTKEIYLYMVTKSYSKDPDL